MDPDSPFIIRKPNDPFLSSIVESYFYLDTTVTQLSRQPEPIIPFPRITFGYFFGEPFTVTNHTINQSALVNIAISKISTQQLSVQPSGETVKILGAHLRPYGLAYFTTQAINKLPWLIDTEELFGDVATNFVQRIHACQTTEQLFDEVETVFVDNLLTRDMELITEAIDLIEANAGNIKVADLSKQLGTTNRTLRNHFNDKIGCSPKEYLRIVRLKQVAYELKHSPESLTHIAHGNEYFDQAHLNHEVKGITGRSPKELKKEIPSFRFLQF
ncbi:helix-turn-helix domain-containing protein [Lewinella sp. IMCC34191]|uniref:helix-turn-helix domain-containing protein n=1 Tax=Lewinella sp. IMCC34191 TaxID=2259172 RepID=UPI000E270650|nr:AraC family transcriptional regulator [Lewinella sp. IMCC34191]